MPVLIDRQPNRPIRLVLTAADLIAKLQQLHPDTPIYTEADDGCCDKARGIELHVASIASSSRGATIAIIRTTKEKSTNLFGF